MVTTSLRYATGTQPVARAASSHAACWHANPAPASALVAAPMVLDAKQIGRVRIVTDFGPRPPLEPSP